jgi:hypothetical protein
MSETTYLESMYKFSKAMVEVFGKFYLKETNVVDTTPLLSINESMRFPQMLANIDFMH